MAKQKSREKIGKIIMIIIVAMLIISMLAYYVLTVLSPNASNY